MGLSKEDEQKFVALEEKHGKPLSSAILREHGIASFEYRLYQRHMQKKDVLPSPMRQGLPTPSPTPSVANRLISSFCLPVSMSAASTSLTTVGGSRHPSPALSSVSSVPETTISSLNDPSSSTDATSATRELLEFESISNIDDYLLNAAYKYLNEEDHKKYLVFREDRTNLSKVPAIRWAQRALRWYKLYRKSGDMKKAARLKQRALGSRNYQARLKKHRECAILCASDLEEKAELSMPGVKRLPYRSLRSGVIRK